METKNHRVWPLQGATNFRDLGGYPTQDGRQVRWRRLFRSDQLGALSAEDLKALAPLGIERALDFRGQHERSAALYALPGIAQHSLAIEPTVVQRLQEVAGSGAALTATVAASLMEELYRSLAAERHHRFAEFFQHVLDCDGPLVFHCTAGKDRTGFAAALFLLALGVSRDLVMQDYMLTNLVYKHPPMPTTGLAPEALQVMWGVQASFLQAALQLVDAEEGGLDGYLARKLGLSQASIAKLAQRYLE